MKSLTAMLILSTLLATGCSNNYTGEYVGIIKHKTISYETAAIPQFHPENTIFRVAYTQGSERGKTYRYDTVKSILSIKQTDSVISGKLTIVNQGSARIYVIKSGHVDDHGIMHLKFNYQPQDALRQSQIVPYLFNPANEVIFNFKQSEANNGNSLTFKTSGALNVFGGIGTNREKRCTIQFEKILPDNRRMAQNFISKVVTNHHTSHHQDEISTHKVKVESYGNIIATALETDFSTSNSI